MSDLIRDLIRDLKSLSPQSLGAFDLFSLKLHTSTSSVPLEWNVLLSEIRDGRSEDNPLVLKRTVGTRIHLAFLLPAWNTVNAVIYLKVTNHHIPFLANGPGSRKSRFLHELTHSFVAKESYRVGIWNMDEQVGWTSGEVFERITYNLW